jgi:hypothetical protein
VNVKVETRSRVDLLLLQQTGRAAAYKFEMLLCGCKRQPRSVSTLGAFSEAQTSSAKVLLGS